MGKGKRSSFMYAPKGATNDVTLAYTINVPIPNVSSTTFALTTLSLDPSKYAGDRVQWQMMGWHKYYVRAVRIYYTSTCSITASSGSLGIAYMADETALKPTDMVAMLRAASQGLGKVLPVKSNGDYTLPIKAIRNVAEGYTPGEAQTPGVLILGPCSSGEVAAPGTMIMQIVYTFMGPRTEFPEDLRNVQVKMVGGPTWDTRPGGSFGIWNGADYLVPTGTTWVYLPSLILSCCPPGTTPPDTYFHLSGYGWLKMPGAPTFSEMVEGTNGSADEWNALMAGTYKYSLDAVTVDATILSPEGVKPWPTTSVFVANIEGYNPVPVIQDVGQQGLWHTKLVEHNVPVDNPLPVKNQTDFSLDPATGVVTALEAGSTQRSTGLAVGVTLPMGGEIVGVAPLPDVNVPDTVSGSPTFDILSAHSAHTPNDYEFWFKVFNAFAGIPSSNSSGKFYRESEYSVQVELLGLGYTTRAVVKATVSDPDFIDGVLSIQQFDSVMWPLPVPSTVYRVKQLPAGSLDGLMSVTRLTVPLPSVMVTPL